MASVRVDNGLHDYEPAPDEWRVNWPVWAFIAFLFGIALLA